MDGMNIIDFVDPDIDAKLAELEREEALLAQAGKLNDDDEVLDKWRGTQGILDELHSRMKQRRVERKLNKTRNHAVLARNAKKKAAKQVEEELNDLGKEGTKV